MPLRLRAENRAVDGEWRELAAEFVVAWYGRNFPDWELIPDDGGGEEWSKGRAVNRALQRTDADTLLIADADSYMLDPASLAAGVRMVQGGAPWCAPHTIVYRLDRGATAIVLGGKKERLTQLDRKPYRGPAGGGMVIVPRWAYEKSRGIDPRFEGWGGEDVSFGLLMKRLYGNAYRAGGDLIHLWHPPAAPNLRGSERNEELVEEWKRACRRRNDIDAYLGALPEIGRLVQ